MTQDIYTWLDGRRKIHFARQFCGSELDRFDRWDGHKRARLLDAMGISSFCIICTAEASPISNGIVNKTKKVVDRRQICVSVSDTKLKGTYSKECQDAERKTEVSGKKKPS